MNEEVFSIQELLYELADQENMDQETIRVLLQCIIEMLLKQKGVEK